VAKLITTVVKTAPFQFSASVAKDGLQVDLTGWSISSQVWTPDGIIAAAVTATIPDQAVNKGKYTFQAATAQWPDGSSLWDMVYQYSDGVGGWVVVYDFTTVWQIF
jgi:hypothetical protein